MKPMIFVALGTGLAGCTVAADSAGEDSTAPPEASTTFGPRLHGRVIEGDGATAKTEDEASLDLAIFWDHYDTEGRDAYAPMKVASVLGVMPLDFEGTLPGAPSADQVRPIHYAKTDYVPDPEAVYGWGAPYATAHRALEEDPEGVESFDLDLVLGMSRDARLFFTSVDLETREGFEGLPEILDDRPLAAGYHLFVGSLEVDFASFIQVELGYVAE